MDTEIREWFDEIWAYCEENWVAVLAFAGVALILLLSVVLISAAKREDRKALQEQAALEKDAEEIQETAEEISAEEAPEAAEETQGAEEEFKPEVQVQEPAETGELQEAAIGMVDSLVKSMESVAGSSGQKVESIELKIEKAQLTIRYAGDAGSTVTEDLFKDLIPEKAAGAVYAEPEAENTDFAENAGRAKRFGFDNMNTARSGRVFTEEELLEQIRD
jgi:hypothetical protein